MEPYRFPRTPDAATVTAPMIMAALHAARIENVVVDWRDDGMWRVFESPVTMAANEPLMLAIADALVIQGIDARPVTDCCVAASATGQPLPTEEELVADAIAQATGVGDPLYPLDQWVPLELAALVAPARPDIRDLRHWVPLEVYYRFPIHPN